ncbi:hypothetical protein QAD02_012189 [Eretmocerus hayati]|uniref:Uncharacterized protein n=1 Tax=Eretmocerus hayati TaxID=131215 RepID=A0ACC2NZ56_9HYME|nr:hypothetical protein QAD02_012189 [Eretmocerus hayati]
MCILFIYRNPNPSKGGYKLIIASNRDEYYARPAKLAHYWEDDPGCLGGMDMEPGREGGTWLALNYESGRAGVLLNLNGTPRSLVGKGRGFLVKDYITSEDSSMKHAEKLHKVNQETQCYNPHNLVMIDLRTSDVLYLSSISNYPGPKVLDKRIMGFGNSGIEHPYQKVINGEREFEKIVINASTSHQESLIENLIEFLRKEKRYLPDDELKKRSPEAFEELSAIFVEHKTSKYGTRTHSIILVDDSNQLTFVEQTLIEDGVWKQQIFTNHLQ